MAFDARAQWQQFCRNLEQAGEAASRIHLCAPISGTVIEKLAVEGEYVRTGQPIYRLADLSTVWLMLELFPEDAATIRYGQKVQAEVHSLPGREFHGRVAFIDPMVNRRTRTVGVRVVIPNPDGILRVGGTGASVARASAGVNAPCSKFMISMTKWRAFLRRFRRLPRPVSPLMKAFVASPTFHARFVCR